MSEVITGDLEVMGKISANMAGGSTSTGLEMNGHLNIAQGIIQVGDGPAQNSIGIALRMQTPYLIGPGQRGISSGPVFSHFATTYAAAIMAQPEFEAGTYTVPDAYLLRLESFVKPATVTVDRMWGLKIAAVNGGTENYSLWTEGGKVSHYDTVFVRNGGFNSILGGATGVPGTWNMPAFKSVGYYISMGGAVSMVDLAGEWNTNMDVIGIKLSIKDTASGANARLMDLQGGANGTTSKFAVEKDGTVLTAGDVEMTTNGAGLVLKSPNGNRWLIKVDNSGVLSTSAL